MKKAVIQVALAGMFQIIVCLNFLYGQTNPDIKRTYHWYFGMYAGIDFSSGQAVVDTNGQLALGSSLGCSVMSDTSGNLLFYTDGKSVWNKNHQKMPNGDSLLSFGSSHQSCIIVPKPANPDIYYIFTTDGFEHGGTWGLRYTTVDLTADGGLGDVTEKNILLFSPNSEILSATKHENCKYIWVVAHERYTNCLRSYLVTESGVDPIPVTSCIGDAGQYAYYGYMLKFSPDGSKAVTTSPPHWDWDTIVLDYVCTQVATTELLNFDNASGIFSNIISLQTDTFIVGLSFSPDNSKLYVYACNIWDNPTRVYQFDVSVWDSSAIATSIKPIVLPTSTVGFGDFQLTPDGKIFTPLQNYYGNTDSIAIIHNPNAIGSACNFESHGLSFGGRLVTYSLPNFIDSYFDTTNCYTGIGEIAEDVRINIFPNPFSSSATVSIPSGIQFIKAEMIIYDLMGRETIRESIQSNNAIINRGKLPEGMYMLRISINNSTYSERIIITN